MFQVGDVVQLKSGGPMMTVYAVGTKEPVSVICKWFDGGELKEERFSSAVLKIAKVEA